MFNCLTSVLLGRITDTSVNVSTVKVFQCLTSMLRSDKSEQVRRAAVHVVTLLLKGLGKDTLEVSRIFLTGLP